MNQVEKNIKLNDLEYSNKRLNLKSFPRYVRLESSNICNMNPRCIFCTNRGEKPCQVDNFTKLYPRVKKYLQYAEILTLHALGEPLANPHLYDIIKGVSKGTKIIFKTNGTLLTEENINKLIKYGVASINISVDAGTSECYEKIRSPFFKDVTDNIQNLVKIKEKKGISYPIVYMNFTIMRSNIHDLPKFIELASRLGVKNVQIKRLHYGLNFKVERRGFMFDYSKEYPSLFKETCDEVMEKSLMLAKKLGLNVLIWGKAFYDKKKEPIYYRNFKLDPSDPWVKTMPYIKHNHNIFSCKQPWQNLEIGVSGRVKVCTEKISVGNILNKDIDRIWNSWLLKFIRLCFILKIPCPFCYLSNRKCVYQCKK